MHPFLYQAETGAGLVRIPMYGLMILLAFAAAFVLVNARARRIGIPPEKLVPTYLAAAAFGLVGARLLYAVAVEPLRTFSDPLSLFSTGGLAFYGGLIGGAVGVFATAKAMKLPGWKLADILAPALVLGLGIGRLGCFFAGCCHGAEAPIGEAATGLLAPGGFLHGQVWLSSQFPFLALEFNDGMGRLQGVPLYPTQLWSVAAGLGVATLSMILWEKRRFDGQIAGLVLLVEPVFRFLIESYRADERGYVVSWEVASLPAWLPPGLTRAGDSLPDAFHPGALVVGLTTSQFLGLAISLIGLSILLLRRNAGVAPEQELAEEL